jgi:2-haloacid dehalogenase
LSARRFDALLIDFYGTICAGDREAVERACARTVSAFGIPMSAADLAIAWGNNFFEVIESSNHDAFRTLYECESLSLRDTLRPFVGEIDPAPYVADLEAYWREAPIHEDALVFLGANKLPVCCVSNADTEALMTALNSHGLRFDAVVTSERARCYKPDPGIFRYALEAMGVDPGRTLHIGDSLHSDVGGAASLGIATAWLCRNERIHDIGDCEADYTASSLTEMITILA